jgi:hypothetical protein
VAKGLVFRVLLIPISRTFFLVDSFGKKPYIQGVADSGLERGQKIS